MSETSTASPVIRSAQQAEQRWFFGGGVHSWLAKAEETAGAFLLFSDVMDKGKRTPLHTHPSDESLYVVDGEILVHLDGHEHTLRAGGLVIAPRAVPHAFLVLSETATMLTLHTPGTCQAVLPRRERTTHARTPIEWSTSTGSERPLSPTEGSRSSVRRPSRRCDLAEAT